MSNLSFSEYKQIQAQFSDNIPCVKCNEVIYNRCRDKGTECIKFIEWTDPDKRSSKRQRDYKRWKLKKEQANGHNDEVPKNIH